MPRIQKPRYLDPLGDPRLSHLSVTPPFLFRNVTARVFPLAASMSVLTRFCDSYLNMDVPPEIAHYAPALPYVYLMVLNYGSMSASSVQAQNAGWVGQHEVTFTVLLQRWREENGQLVFKDWATVSPFIFVDDGLSLNTGREVYGWNKVAGVIDSTIPLWLNEPRAKLRQFDLSVVDFRTAYAGDTESLQHLLRVELEPPPTFLQFPPDPRNPWSPIWATPAAIANTASLAGSLIDTAMSLRIRGYESSQSRDGLKAMAREAGAKLKAILPQIKLGGRPTGNTAEDITADLPMLFFDNVTLKQFRNPEDPNLACYQALVNSRMGVDRLNRAGLLGDVNFLRGDSSGGYSIDLHELDAQPIISTLGIEVASWRHADTSIRTATIRPVLPYWLDVDLFYGEGHVICSRTPWGPTGPRGDWVDEREPTSASSHTAYGESPDEKAEPAPPPQYNSSLGAATQAISGPFTFPDITLQVYPLLSDAKKVREMIDRHLNGPLAEMFKPNSAEAAANIEKGWRFEPFGSYVYMMVTVYGEDLGEEWSASNNIGGFFSREVTFCIPVKWFDNEGKLVSVAVIEPFTYSNSGRGVATDREVNGYNSILATIDSPQDVWLNSGGPIGKRTFLSLSTEIFSAVNTGQRAEQGVLIEIDERDVVAPDEAALWQGVADRWGRDQVDELRRKTSLAAPDAERDDIVNVKALALELLVHGKPFNRLIYKQYRDSQDPSAACYQALVHATSTITSIYDVRELDANCHVRFHRAPGHMIPDALGLKIKVVSSEGGSVVDVVEPVRPFWMRIAMREDLASVACYRARDEPWRVVHPWFTRPPGDDPTARDAEHLPLARGIGPLPFFSRPGGGRTGAWLARRPDDVSDLRPMEAPASPTDDADIVAAVRHGLEADELAADLHLDLRMHALDWERRALVNEMAWIRTCVEPTQDTDPSAALWRDALIESGDEAVRDFVNCPLKAPLELGLIRNITEKYSTRDLWLMKHEILALIRRKDLPNFPDPEDEPGVGETHAAAAKAAGPKSIGRWSRRFYDDLNHIADGFDAYFKASTHGIERNVWSWDGYVDGRRANLSLNSSVARFRKLPRVKRRAFMLSLPPGTQAMLTEVAGYVDGPEFSGGAPTAPHGLDPDRLQEARRAIQRVKTLAGIIETSLLDWVAPSRWRRLPILEGARSVEALDEVQLVVENILSSEWENRGRTRWSNPKAGRLPDAFIDDDPAIELIARAGGLARWIDPVTGEESDYWISPLPGQPSKKAAEAAEAERAAAKPRSKGQAQPSDQIKSGP